jgi:glycosyltransferase involved in cell wall biosynthesis
MKVVNVGINLIPSRGGIYNTVTSFARAFKELDYGGRVLNCGRSTESHSEFGSSWTFIKTSPLPVLRQYFFWHGFWTGAAQEVIGAPDLVFIHGLFYHTAAAAAAYCRRRGIPYILVSHGSLDPVVFTYRWIRKEAWTRIYRKRLLVESSAVVFSTRTEAEKAAKWTSGSKVRIIPWPVEHIPDYDKYRARAMLLEKYDLPRQTRVAIFCGRLDPIKRPLETIRHFKATAGSDWALLLVGPPTDRLPVAAVEAACREPGPRSIWVGPAYGQNLIDHFRAAELFILLSAKENFSHATAEALALGVPVFLSRGVDLWRDLAPADCSFVAPDDQSGPLRAALARVLSSDPDELGAAGKRGRDWVRKELSAERFAQRLGELCEAVASTGG